MRSYFEPNRLELWRERSIYELLGVRFFKRYLLPIELLVNRLRGGTAMQGRQDGLRVELKRLEWETKRNEVIQWTKLVAYPREPQPFIQRFKIGEIRGRMQPLFNVCDRLDVRQGRCEIVQCDLGPVAVPEACL